MALFFLPPSRVKRRENLCDLFAAGIADLDRQAVAIVRAAAPYGPFPPEMRKQIDVLDWVSTFEFMRDGAINRSEGNRLELRP